MNNNVIFAPNQDVSKSKFCLMYFSIILIIMVVIIVNYVETRNAFKDNKVFIFRGSQLCHNFTSDLDSCQKNDRMKAENNNCAEKILKVKECYSDV